MSVQNGLSETEVWAWMYRVGMGVIAFFLCLGVKDAKKSLDSIPDLKATVEQLAKAQEALFRRIEKLEEKR